MSFDVGHTRVRLHPALALLVPLSALLGLEAALWPLILSLTLHESAHLLAARLLRVRVTELRLMPFGGAAELGNLYALSPGSLFAIAAAGPCANLALMLTASALCQWGWLPPRAALNLLHVNLSLMLFNLLPALPLDGGRMLYALTCKKLGRDRAANLGILLGRALALALTTLAFAGVLRTGRFNLSLMACAVFIAASAQEERRALTDLSAVTLLNALRRHDGPIDLHLCAVSAECPALSALRRAAPDAATLFAVYEKDALSAFTDERQLLKAAIKNPHAKVKNALTPQGRQKRRPRHSFTCSTTHSMAR